MIVLVGKTRFEPKRVANLCIVVFCPDRCPPSPAPAVPILQERQAAARAYASCISVQRSSSDAALSPTPSSPSGPPGVAPRGAEECYPRTLPAMTALSSALLPTLTWDGALAVPDEVISETAVPEPGSSSSVEGLLEAVLSKVC